MTASVEPLPCPFACGTEIEVSAGASDLYARHGYPPEGSSCPLAKTSSLLSIWNRRSPSPAPTDTTTYRVVQDTRGQWWLWQAVPSNGGFVWTTVGDTPIEVVAARSSSPSSGIATAKNEIGWLIEDVRSRGAMPRWWDGRSWTHDSMKAVRFAREDDAFAIILFTMPDGLHLVSQATEHMWCAPLPSSGDAPATLEDTKRLDWLESELAEGRGPEFVAAEYCEHYCVAPSGFQIGSVGGATLREAIDASRSHSETPNG